MRKIEALPTEHGGVRMRSRLEARWARFFDVAKVEWEYEPRTYRLRNGAYYIPDFWIPNGDCHFEIKPPSPGKEELSKAMALPEVTGKPIFILIGRPGHFGMMCGGDAEKPVTRAIERGYRPSRDPMESDAALVIGIGGGDIARWDLAIKHAWSSSFPREARLVGDVIAKWMAEHDPRLRHDWRAP